MRTIFILVLLAAQTATADEAAQRPAFTHVRAHSPSAVVLIANAMLSSPVAAALAADLEHSDVYVYVSDSIPGSLPRAYTVFLGYGRGGRYLQIRIDPWVAPTAVRIALLAHELQHAREVAAAPEVRDEAGLRGLYQRIGWEVSKGRFESDAAVAIQRRVLDQLTRPARRRTVGSGAEALLEDR